MELLYTLINCFVYFLCPIAICAAIQEENKNVKLKAENDRLRKALEYKDRVLDMYVKRDQEQQDKKRTQVSVKVLDGKLVGYIGK